ncbi:hypothetical protein NX059_000829 [Plenodomus lindquistii]|nr:hypothetical protein NX059_000829 [Plenodomus lindquistii]
MLGGVDLQTLAKLQEKSIDSYEKAAQELKDRNEELYFYTPRHRVTIKDRISSTNSLPLVVTPPLQEADAFFTKNFINEIKGSELLF